MSVSADQLAPASSGGRAARLDRCLADLLEQAPEIEAATVVSFDGLAMAAALPAEMDEDRVAAMSAALLSLGERAAQGLGRGDLSQVYVEGENGTVFLVSALDEAVLVAVAAKEAKTGLMLFEVRRAAVAVGTVLQQDVEGSLELFAVPEAPAEETDVDDQAASTVPEPPRNPEPHEYRPEPSPNSEPHEYDPAAYQAPEQNQPRESTAVFVPNQHVAAYSADSTTEALQAQPPQIVPTVPNAVWAPYSESSPSAPATS